MKILPRTLLFLILFLTLLVHGQAKVLLPIAKPEKVGLDPKKLKAVDQKMEELIKEGRLAGGIVVIGRKGKVAHF